METRIGMIGGMACSAAPAGDTGATITFPDTRAGVRIGRDYRLQLANGSSQIITLPARRYADLVEAFRRLAFDEQWLAEATFASHRLIVAHDPLRAEEQSGRRRARIAALEAMAEKMVGRLDAQDGGQTAKGRRASDRGAHSRFTRAVAEAELSRFIKADLSADRFSWSVVDDAVAKAELFDGKLALITNAPDLTAANAVARTGNRSPH